MDTVAAVRFRLVSRTDVNAISAGYLGDEVGFLQTSRSRRMIYAPNFFAGRIAQGNFHVDSSLLDRQVKIFGGFQFHRPTIWSLSAGTLFRWVYQKVVEWFAAG